MTLPRTMVSAPGKTAPARCQRAGRALEPLANGLPWPRVLVSGDGLPADARPFAVFLLPLKDAAGVQDVGGGTQFLEDSRLRAVLCPTMRGFL